MSKIYQNKSKKILIYYDKQYGLYFFLGTKCGNDCWCKFRKQCKYRQRFWRHNLSVNVHTFFQYKLHIKLPYSRIHFDRNRQELSGTPKCPYHTTLETGCHRCVHCCGADEDYHLLCGLPKDQRKKPYHDDFWQYQCANFEDVEGQHE